MSDASQNKALIRKYLDEVWQKNNISALEEYLSPAYKRYLSPTAPPLDLEGQRQRLKGFRAAFPEVQITVEEMIAEGDRVAFRCTMRTVHKGPFQGIQPTGRSLTVTLLDVIRIEDGKFVEHWGGPDLFDLLKQTGANFSI